MKQRYFYLALFVITVSIGVYYFVRFFRFHPSLNGLGGGRFWLLIGLSVAFQLFAHFIRADKSKLLIRHISQTKTTPLFSGLAVGFLFNTVLPLRLGEIIRAIYTGDALAISKTSVFISIIIERIVDGVVLGCSFLLGALLVRGTSPAAFSLLSGLGLGLLAVAGVLAICIQLINTENPWLLKIIRNGTAVFNQRIANRLRFTAWSGLYGTRLMLSQTRDLRRYVLATVLM